MPFATIPESPLAGSSGPVRLFYRQYSPGHPLIFLHGGWGYQIYPFGRQIDLLRRRFGVVIPDRSGYGKSGRIAALPIDFHHRAAAETRALLDALDIDKAVLWGHSDGAVIAALMALDQPERYSSVVLEAFHYFRNKPLSSQAFFETMVRNPESFGERVSSALSAEHGADYWKDLLKLGGQAWIDIGADARPERDLYGGRLGQLRTPVMVLHGTKDPRTEPEEMESVERVLPGAVKMVAGGGHSPHSEEAVAVAASDVATNFLAKVSTWVRA